MDSNLSESILNSMNKETSTEYLSNMDVSVAFDVYSAIEWIVSNKYVKQMLKFNCKL